MGMFEFRLTLLLCSLTIYKSLDAASVLDNSSDLWRNWLLNENEEVLSQQGPPLTRRITPKSVFIAPVFDKCPPGTRLDSMGKCVKIVRIDKWEILVNKLNAAFAQGSSKNETSTREPTTTTTTMTTTTTTTTTTMTTKMTTTDVPSSTLYAKENSTVDVAEDISGPFQLSIPLNAKNVTEGADDDSSPLYVRGNLTSVFNESEMSTTTTTTTTETENPSESVTEGYDAGDATTLLPSFEVTLSTVYPDANTAESAGFATELTTAESSTTSSSSDLSTDVQIVPSSSPPKRYFVHRRPSLEHTSSRPPDKWTVTPVANFVYSYTSADILKVPVRFPELSRRNESSALHSNGGEFGATNDSDISDSTISGSSGVSNSNNNVILSSSSSSSKSDLYQKLPSNGRTRPKCDPITGYGDCTPPSKTGPPEKASYLRGGPGGGPPPVTTIIRFPATYTKGTSMVRFPTNAAGGGVGGGGGGGIIADQQQHHHKADDQTVAFPDMEVGAASRYWESSRYPASYWNPWDPSKPHFVRIWPSNVAGAAATTYNMNSDVNYNYRSQPEDYS